MLEPAVPLDPNLVKALIATESSFNCKAKAKASKNNFARGLMQVTDQTLRILADERGELKDFYITLTHIDMIDPNLNICAGVRWLFRKHATARARLKRDATWMETIAEYKAYLPDMLKDPKLEPDGIKNTKLFFEKLSKP